MLTIDRRLLSYIFHFLYICLSMLVVHKDRHFCANKQHICMCHETLFHLFFSFEAIISISYSEGLLDCLLFIFQCFVHFAMTERT